MKKDVYVALLRGINVSGQKLIKMETLRPSLTALGLTDVQTYIQSGNVVLTAPRSAPEALSHKIQTAIAQDFGFEVAVIVRSAEQLGELLKRNPFLESPGVDAASLHVTFLTQTAPQAALHRLEKMAITAEPDRLHHLAQEIYLHCPNGYGRSKLTNTALEKALGLQATTRNWNTLNKLYAMAQEY